MLLMMASRSEAASFSSAHGCWRAEVNRATRHHAQTSAAVPVQGSGAAKSSGALYRKDDDLEVSTYQCSSLDIPCGANPHKLGCC